MEGTSISNNFILYSENLKSDDLKKSIIIQVVP